MMIQIATLVVAGAVALIGLLVLRNSGNPVVQALAGEALAAAVSVAKGILKVKLRPLVAKAEQAYGDKTGQLKLGEVLNAITDSDWFNALPVEVRRELDASRLTVEINAVVEEWLKPAMTNNEKVKAIIDGIAG